MGIRVSLSFIVHLTYANITYMSREVISVSVSEGFWGQFSDMSISKRLVYERCEELTSKYPLPPYEPTLTSLPGLAQEVLWCLNQMGEGHLSRDSVRPLIDEFKHTWDNDLVMQREMLDQKHRHDNAVTQLRADLSNEGGNKNHAFVSDRTVVMEAIARDLSAHSAMVGTQLVDLVATPSATLSEVEAMAEALINYAFVDVGWSSKGLHEVLRKTFRAPLFSAALTGFVSRISANQSEQFTVYVDVSPSHVHRVPPRGDVEVSGEVLPIAKGFSNRTYHLRTVVQATDAWAAASMGALRFEELGSVASIQENRSTTLNLGQTYFVRNSNGEYKFTSPRPTYLSAVRLSASDVQTIVDDAELRDVVHWIRVGNESLGEERLLAYWIAMEYLSWRPQGGNALKRVTELNKAIWSSYYFPRTLRTLSRLASSMDLPWTRTEELVAVVTGDDWRQSLSGSVRSPLLKERLNWLGNEALRRKSLKSSLEQAEWLTARIYRIRNVAAHRASRTPGLRTDWLSAKTARLLRAHLRLYSERKRGKPNLTPREFFYEMQADGALVDYGKHFVGDPHR